MIGLSAALWTEALKARRSRLLWLTALGFSLAPLMGGLFMIVLRDPEWARSTGLLTAKAQLTVGTADWPTYWGVLAQATALGGMFLFGLVATWVFGREYSDHTAKDLLALPTAREAIVVAKFVVVACWSALLTAMVWGLGWGVGSAIGLSGSSPDLTLYAAGQIAVVAGLTILLLPPFALVASAGRGYLPSIGSIFLAVFLAQILAALGWGPYFPWAVPSLLSGAAGPSAAELGAESYLVVALAGLAGVAGTLAWWRFADQT